MIRQCGDVNGLARFRASPVKVRVTIHRFRDVWVVTVASRARPEQCFTSCHKRPVRATYLALKQASRAELDGIDLGMGWAYDHPMRRAAP